MIDLQISSGAEEGIEGPWFGKQTGWMKGGRLDAVSDKT